MYMHFADATTGFALLAFVSACWALWVRRHTWGSFWERPATMAVTLNGVGLLLASSWAANTLGHWLFGVTGVGGLSNYLGHQCALGGTAAFVLHMQIRTRPPNAAQMRREIHRRITLPLTFAVPVMLALLVQASHSGHVPVNIVGVHTGGWLLVYWLVFCAVALYLEVVLAQLLLEVRNDARSRRLATAYLMAVLFAIMAIGICVLVKLYDDSHDGRYMWLLGCLSVMVFNGGTAWSWVAKCRWYRKALKSAAPQGDFGHITEVINKAHDVIEQSHELREQTHDVIDRKREVVRENHRIRKQSRELVTALHLGDRIQMCNSGNRGVVDRVKPVHVTWDNGMDRELLRSDLFRVVRAG